jgi:hypothetical protein
MARRVLRAIVSDPFLNQATKCAGSMATGRGRYWRRVSRGAVVIGPVSVRRVLARQASSIK